MRGVEHNRRRCMRFYSDPSLRACDHDAGRLWRRSRLRLIVVPASERERTHKHETVANAERTALSTPQSCGMGPRSPDDGEITTPPVPHQPAPLMSDAGFRLGGRSALQRRSHAAAGWRRSGGRMMGWHIAVDQGFSRLVFGFATARGQQSLHRGARVANARSCGDLDDGPRIRRRRG